MKIINSNYHGLTLEEVEKQKELGNINITEQHITKSVKDILKDNILTFFNLLNFVLFLIIVFAGSLRNSLFMNIVLINTCTGIYQELKAKRILDKLTVIHSSKIDVLREDQIYNIDINEIVLNDSIILLSGMQIPADCLLLDGQLEVNESLVTGESDAINKTMGDFLYSGSFITSGKALAAVYHVGKDNFASKIVEQAKKYDKHPSQLRESLDIILKVVSFLIVPVGILLFLKQYLWTHITVENALTQTVAGIMGMIPEGLILLTSIALTVSVIRLAKREVLVQELYSIESLARIDTLCLDKTGTLTNGEIAFRDLIVLKGTKEQAISYIKELNEVIDEKNATQEALEKYYGKGLTGTPCYVIPFSSNRKYSGATFNENYSIYLGAYGFVCHESHELNQMVTEYATQGYRVLVLCHSNTTSMEDSLPEDNEPIALLLFSDRLRPHVKETMQFFKDIGVDIKIISGDDSSTVSAIAKEAGIFNSGKYIDMSCNDIEDYREFVDEYTIFGRVSPKQKKDLIHALKERGHTVGMTGDGVNDVLAFKEADCSVAMASGSDASKNAANVVLLDNNFDAMPDIVNEGRRVINNITCSSSMFLIKTLFSFMLSLVTIFAAGSYPFKPIQLSIISSISVGIPTFFLTFEPNYNKITRGFLYTVFSKAFPTAFAITAMISTLKIIDNFSFISEEEMLTCIVITTAINWILALMRVYQPITKYRTLIIGSIAIVFTFGMIVILQVTILRNFLYLTPANIIIVLVITGAVILSQTINIYIGKVLFYNGCNIIGKYHEKRKEHRV